RGDPGRDGPLRAGPALAAPLARPHRRRPGRPGARPARAVLGGASLPFLPVAGLAPVACASVALPPAGPPHPAPPAAAPDPRPAAADPVLAGLRDEKAAHLRAITELDERTGLPPARREQLRARYEAKAAAALRALDELAAELGARERGAKPAARAQARRRTPVAAVSLLAVAVAAAAFLPAYVLPRVGQD